MNGILQTLGWWGSIVGALAAIGTLVVSCRVQKAVSRALLRMRSRDLAHLLDVGRVRCTQLRDAIAQDELALARHLAVEVHQDVETALRRYEQMVLQSEVDALRGTAKNVENLMEMLDRPPEQLKDPSIQQLMRDHARRALKTITEAGAAVQKAVDADARGR